MATSLPEATAILVNGASAEPLHRKPKRIRRLSRAGLTRRLERTNPLVLAHLHEMQRSRVQDEADRGVRLETKASTLIGANALTLAIVSSVGVNVLVKRDGDLKEGWLFVMILAYAAAVFFGLATGWRALRVVKVADYHKLDDDDLFPDDVLTAADDAKNSEEGLALYHRFSAVCASKILKEDSAVNDKKAAQLGAAQKAFTWFLTAVGLLASLSILYAVFR